VICGSSFFESFVLQCPSNGVFGLVHDLLNALLSLRSGLSEARLDVSQPNTRDEGETLTYSSLLETHLGIPYTFRI